MLEKCSHLHTSVPFLFSPFKTSTLFCQSLQIPLILVSALIMKEIEAALGFSQEGGVGWCVCVCFIVGGFKSRHTCTA